MGKFFRLITVLLFFASSAIAQPIPGNSTKITDGNGHFAGITSNALNVNATLTPSGTQNTNETQVGSTAIDTNSGIKSAGTQRVVLATDQPQLTNKLLVTPDSVALPANQSVNESQVNGTTVDTNSGTKSAGTMRVVLATDQPQLTNKLLVTPDSVALPANQSVNEAQVAGTTTSVNNGTADAGTERVTLASNSTGTVGLNAGTNTIGGITIPDVTTNGTMTAITNTVGMTGLNGQSTATVTTTGVWTGTNINECSVDGTNYIAVPGYNLADSTLVVVGGYTTNKSYQVNIAGCTAFRVRASATMTGTQTVFMRASVGPAIAFGPGNSSINLQQVNGNSVVTSNNGLAVGGDTASGATDAGNPVKMGFLAKTTNPTAVTTGQRVAGLSDKLGKQVVVHAIRDLKGRQHTTITGTAETTIATAVASTFLDLYGLTITNTSATTTNCSLRDTTAGSIVQVFAAPANDTRGYLVEASSGLNQTTVFTNWTLQCAAAVTSIEVTAEWVQNL